MTAVDKTSLGPCHEKQTFKYMCRFLDSPVYLRSLSRSFTFHFMFLSSPNIVDAVCVDVPAGGSALEQL